MNKPRFLYTHKKGLTLVVIILIAIILMIPDIQKRPRYHLIERPVVFIASFFQRGITLASESISGLWNGYVNLINVKKENILLKEEVEYLKAENSKYKEMAHSFGRIQALLDFKESAPFKTMSARIIGKDTSNLFKTFTIDRGEQDGIKRNMAVISPNAVVGHIIRTSRDSSLVLLAADRNSEIAVIIQRTRDEGILEGSGSGLANLKYIPILADIQAGDVLITSGLDGIYPKGLNIGRVTAVKKEKAAIFQEVAASLDADFAKLEEILVLLNQ